jgi:hypothetical protein
MTVTIINNSETGKPRGFGFVKFQDESSVERVLASRPHHINGKKVPTLGCASIHTLHCHTKYHAALLSLYGCL